MNEAARVAILGAESTGKSTLAEALAMYYDTVWVPEYLREFVEVQGRVLRASCSATRHPS
jgi:nicotinamide riboside kinase